MTKKNTELFEQITATVNSFDKAPDGLLDALKALLETNSSTGATNPNKIIDGIEYKWCNRHHQYEAIKDAKFRTKKDGSLWPTCQIAYEQYVAYGKQINALRKKLNAVIAGTEKGDIAAIATEINQLEITRKAKDIAYDRAGTESYALEA